MPCVNAGNGGTAMTSKHGTCPKCAYYGRDYLRNYCKACCGRWARANLNIGDTVTHVTAGLCVIVDYEDTHGESLYWLYPLHQHSRFEAAFYNWPYNFKEAIEATRAAGSIPVPAP